MRTILRVELQMPAQSPGAPSSVLSTEVIVEDGDEREAGRAAADALWHFAQGYDEGGANGPDA